MDNARMDGGDGRRVGLAATIAGLILAGGLLAGALLAGSPAAADEEDTIDCSATPFIFSEAGFFVDCLRIEARASKDGASGLSTSDLINIASSERSMFLTVISRRLTAVRMHMRRQDLRESMRTVFSSIELDGWNGIGNKSGYDMAEFSAEISGQPSHCIALQRYLNPSNGGYKRQVIGIGCAAAADLAPVYAALSKLRAPGD